MKYSGAYLEGVLPPGRAAALERALLSQDDDLPAIAWERQATGVFFARLIRRHRLTATAGKYALDLEVVCRVNIAHASCRFETALRRAFLFKIPDASASGGRG
jgi:hypothetical protein